MVLSCSAQDITDEIMQFSGADNLPSLLPESLAENDELSNMTPQDNMLENALNKLISLVADAIRNEFSGFLGICAMLVVCAVLRVNSGLFPQGSSVLDYVCMLCISGYCYIFVSGTLDVVMRAISEIDTFMSAMLPVTVSLYTVSGNAASALVHNAGMYAVLTFFEKINANLLAPLFNACFALTMVCSLSSVNLWGIVKFIKNFTVRLCVTLLAILVSVLYFQTVFSSAADSLALRGVKYAATFIPIVGALVGEAARTVAAGISVIKTSAGIFAVSAVLYTALIPAAAIITKKILLSICVIVGNIAGAHKEAALVEEVNNILSILLAVLLSVGIFFILALTIFIKTAVAV